jgi:hypothetical protein
MAIARFFLLCGLLVSPCAMAIAPELYRAPMHESPVDAEPDDLLLLAGYGFAAGDAVVYRALVDAVEAPATPSNLPSQTNADLGQAMIVSTANAPYSLTVKLPQIMRSGQTYALWVRNTAGEWSKPIKINDARPLWLTPAYVYASRMPGFLPREIKIVGRNFHHAEGTSTRVRLDGPERLIVTSIPDAQSPPILAHFVARVPLPKRLKPGSYRIAVSRDDDGWVELDGQSLEVLPDPPEALVAIADPRFGGCRPDDGIDDTACVIRAIAAARLLKGGTVYFGRGTWDLIDGNQPGMVRGEGIVVPTGVGLRGAGSAFTRVLRHVEWNRPKATPAFTLEGHTDIAGFTFKDLQIYEPKDQTTPFLQLGADSEGASAQGTDAYRPGSVEGVTIARNVFDKPSVAIGSGGLPIKRLLITYNTFGAYHSALELSGNKYDMAHRYRIDESIIDYNMFKPGSELDLERKTGSIASELGAGYRVDFSNNIADGASTDYLYSPSDAKGWRAAFFWSMNNDVEEVLVSQNTASCTGDKIGDGEAIAFDNNNNTFAFPGVTPVVVASSSSVSVEVALAKHQNNRDVPSDYYVGHWVQIVSGPGLGETRKIVGYSVDPLTHVVTFNVSPEWDVTPVPEKSRVAVGREFWQLYAVDNHIDSRKPLCQKSNRSRQVSGEIVMWAQSADSVIAGNHQYDSDGIFVQQSYNVPEHACPDCTMEGFFHSFLQIRDNVVDGEYDWSSDCSASGIVVGVAAASSGDPVPPTVGFGLSISHNLIRHADAQRGGAIAQLSSWIAGPEPHRWPLSDNLLIHHNSIQEIDGPRARAVCGTGNARMGITFPEPAIAWRTVLYANSCRQVNLPIGPGGTNVIRVCPSPVADSCECP